MIAYSIWRSKQELNIKHQHAPSGDQMGVKWQHAQSGDEQEETSLHFTPVFTLENKQILKISLSNHWTIGN